MTTTSTKALRANFPEITPQVIVLPAGGCTLGRASDCAMVVLRPLTSRLHARIAWDGHYFVLADSQSQNGTFVNGRPLRAPHKLKHGDEIGLGDPTGLIVYLDEDKTVQPVTHLRFDFKDWCFFWDAEKIDLSSDQQALLLHLFEHRGEICVRHDCARAVWGHNYDGLMDSDALDQVLSRLRLRLRGICPDAGDLIVTVRGKGYMLKLT